VDAIGGKDECISWGYGKSFNPEWRQLKSYNASAQQQRFRVSSCETATKQNALDIPHSQPRYQPTGHVKRCEAHSDSARRAECFMTPTHQHRHRLCRMRLQDCSGYCGCRRSFASMSNTVQSCHKHAIMEGFHDVQVAANGLTS
jgi:hypothetical protein